MLGTIQSSNVSDKNKLPSVASAKVEKDLRRVLAREEEEKSTCDASCDPKTKRNKKRPTVNVESKPPPSDGGSCKQSEASVSSSR